MPELPPFNPTVSVFHFTSKVSSAKIRKYKLATERGMTNGHSVNGRKPVNRQPSHNSPTPADGDQTKDRSRVKLNVRRTSDMADGDTIAVKQPSRSKPATKRDWNDAFGKDKPAQGHDLLAGDSSSELSSLDSNVSTPKSPQTIHLSARGSKATGDRASQRESYGDLMSYYIQDDDDEPAETTSSKREGKSTGRVKKHAKAQQTDAQPHTQMPTTGSFSQYPVTQPDKGKQKQNANRQGNHMATTQQPQSQAHPRPQPQPQPRIHFPSFEPINVGPPDSLLLMIAKVEALSTALTEFGGGAAPPSPTISAQTAKLSDDHEASFLVFGEGDHALTYGIQFIMNALQSWAQQRLTREHIIAMQQGRPNPSNVTLLDQGLTAMTLAGTPEGRAIAAFRAVVESGCLRVNTRVPVALSRALRKLYLQIDQLINQGTKQNTPWRCLSYHAQIQANMIRVKSWKDEQARAHQEMIRQHQLSHQQTMRQMGLPTHLTSTMFYQQPQDPSAAYVDQPGDSYNNLIRLPMQVLDSTAVTRPASSTTTNMLLTPLQPGARAVLHAGNISTTTAATDRSRPHAEHDSTGSTAYLLHRSGQSMNLSFAPTASPPTPNNQHSNSVNSASAQVSHAATDTIHVRPPSSGPALAPASKLADSVKQEGPSHKKQAHGHGITPTGFTAINAR